MFIDMKHTGSGRCVALCSLAYLQAKLQLPKHARILDFRLNHENDTVEIVLEGGFDTVPIGSDALRVLLRDLVEGVTHLANDIRADVEQLRSLLAQAHEIALRHNEYEGEGHYYLDWIIGHLESDQAHLVMLADILRNENEGEG